MRCLRRPSPGSQPPITSSWRPTFLTFSQLVERAPGSYGESRRFATSPSRPCCAVAASTSEPLPVQALGRLPRLAVKRQRLQQLAALLVGEPRQ